jgi:hypothetical protein
VAVTLDQAQGLSERHGSVEAKPFTCMAMPGDVKTVSGDILQTREWRVELGLERVRIVRAEALQEAVLVAMPFAHDGNRVVERGGSDCGQEARSQNLSQKALAGGRNRRLLRFGWLRAHQGANTDPLPSIEEWLAFCRQ